MPDEEVDSAAGEQIELLNTYVEVCCPPPHTHTRSMFSPSLLCLPRPPAAAQGAPVCHQDISAEDQAGADGHAQDLALSHRGLPAQLVRVVKQWVCGGCRCPPGLFTTSTCSMPMLDRHFAKHADSIMAVMSKLQKR